MRRKSYIVFIIIAVIAVIVFRPGSSLYTKRQINNVEEALKDIESLVKDISELTSGGEYKRNSRGINNRLESLSSEIKVFSENISELSETEVIDDYVGRFIEEHNKLDEVVVKIFSSPIDELEVIEPGNVLFEADVIDKLFHEEIITLPYTATDFSTLGSLMESKLDSSKYIFQEFRLAELANQIFPVIVEGGGLFVPTDDPDIISKLREDLLLRFSGRLQGASSSTITLVEDYLLNTPGDKVVRLSLLDQVRENIIDSEVKTKLNKSRQQLIEQIKDRIDALVVDDAVFEVEDVIKMLEQEIDDREGDVSRTVQKTLERAKFHLDQALTFSEKRNYGSAYGQATAARVAAESVLFPFTVNIDTYKDDIQFLKERYDDLIANIEFYGLDSESIREFRAEAEEDILTVSRLLETDSESNKTFITIKNLKIFVATFEQYVNERLPKVAE